MTSKSRAHLLAAVVAVVGLLLTSCSPAVSANADANLIETGQDAANPGPETFDRVTTVRLGSPRGAATMALAGMIHDQDQREAANLNLLEGNIYDFTIVGAPDQLTAALATGNIDAALLPVNVAATLYNRTDGAVQLAAITAQGLFYALAADSTITSFADLDGRKVYTTGLGATPEFVINYFSAHQGVSPRVDFSSEATAALTQLVTDPAGVGILPEPFVTSALKQNPGLSVVIDLNDAWMQATGSPLVTTALVVRTDFAQAHRESVATLLADLTLSVEWVNATPADAAPVIEAQGIVPSAAIAQAAIPRTNLVAMTSGDARTATLAFLRVLHAAHPESVGGSIPGDGFFLN
ncbi:MAG: ABC transporter substrate-binding protein [Cellulomonadaceae bacterium]|jgi:NitT/TauT family transport system substrate-binding protein|nr:ABC transporter substrate-binding protein [Cellulomonadaceae bacterium]